MSELSCAELVELVTAYFDRVLEVETEQRFREHLAYCEGCETYLEQFRRTIDTVGDLPPEGVPGNVRDALLKAFRNWPS